VPGRLAVGAAFGLDNMHSDRLAIESPLLDAAPTAGEAAPEDDGSETSLVNPLNSILVGAQLVAGRMRLLGDVQYTRANKDQEAFSIVEFKKKRKDVYDTLAVRTGAIFAMTDTGDALVGFRYEPASLGPGSRSGGDGDGAIGFGTQDVVMMFAGFETLTPYWQLGLGARLSFGRHKTYNAWSVASGLVYRRASLGIDENGEQPGAYLLEKTFVPVTVTYKL
jgi:hypothetical protein